MLAKYDLHHASSLDQLKKNTLPILFLHGEKDTFVPFSNMDMLYQAASGTEEKHSFPDAGHGASLSKHTELYWEIIDSFIDRHM